MAEPVPKDITELLGDLRHGDEGAAEELAPLVYDELRRMARRYLRRERPDHTLEPTALVHEAFLRLAGQRSFRCRDRRDFFAVAARIMRRILVDHARRYRYAKRDGIRVPLEAAKGEGTVPAVAELLAVDEALRELAGVDELKASIVELRFFGGLTLEETAEVLGCSRPTVVRHWRVARAWLYEALRGDPAP